MSFATQQGFGMVAIFLKSKCFSNIAELSIFLLHILQGSEDGMNDLAIDYCGNPADSMCVCFHVYCQAGYR